MYTSFNEFLLFYESCINLQKCQPYQVKFDRFGEDLRMIIGFVDIDTLNVFTVSTIVKREDMIKLGILLTEIKQHVMNTWNWYKFV